MPGSPRNPFDEPERARRARPTCRSTSSRKLVAANALDARADSYYALGEQAGGNADGYVRTTIYLATVLFLVGISGHFKVRAARTGLIVVAGAILAFSSVLLILAPKPPV